MPLGFQEVVYDSGRFKIKADHPYKSLKRDLTGSRELRVSLTRISSGKIDYYCGRSQLEPSTNSENYDHVRYELPNLNEYDINPISSCPDSASIISGQLEQMRQYIPSSCQRDFDRLGEVILSFISNQRKNLDEKLPSKGIKEKSSVMENTIAFTALKSSGLLPCDSPLNLTVLDELDDTTQLLICYLLIGMWDEWTCHLARVADKLEKKQLLTLVEVLIHLEQEELNSWVRSALNSGNQQVVAIVASLILATIFVEMRQKTMTHSLSNLIDNFRQCNQKIPIGEVDILFEEVNHIMVCLLIFFQSDNMDTVVEMLREIMSLLKTGAADIFSNKGFRLPKPFYRILLKEESHPNFRRIDAVFNETSFS